MKGTFWESHQFLIQLLENYFTENLPQFYNQND